MAYKGLNLREALSVREALSRLLKALVAAEATAECYSGEGDWRAGRMAGDCDALANALRAGRHACSGAYQQYLATIEDKNTTTWEPLCGEEHAFERVLSCAEDVIPDVDSIDVASAAEYLYQRGVGSDGVGWLRFAIYQEWWIVVQAINGLDWNPSPVPVHQAAESVLVTRHAVVGECGDVNGHDAHFEGVLGEQGFRAPSILQISRVASALGERDLGNDLKDVYENGAWISWTGREGDEDGRWETVQALDRIDAHLDALLVQGNFTISADLAVPQRSSQRELDSALQKQQLEVLASRIATRLNNADHNILQAIGELIAAGNSSPTQTEIATAAGGTQQRMRELVAAMLRHGLFDRSSDGKGVVLSELGELVATRLATRVASD